MPATDPTTTMTPSMSAVLAALSAERGASVTELSGHAGLGRSTAARVLTTLEGMGLARRERPDRSADHSSPDLWFTAATEQATPATSDDAPTGGEPQAEPDTQPSATTPETDADETQPAQNGDPEHAAESETTLDGDRADEPTAPNNEAEPEGGLDGEAAITQPEPEAHSDPALALDADPATAGSGAASEPNPEPEARSATGSGSEPDALTMPDSASATGGTATENAAAPSGNGATVRLGKGELRALVAAHLQAHPDEEFTASQVGKALKKSSGAVSNNFDALVKIGDAEMTCEKPRRFRYLAKAAN